MSHIDTPWILMHPWYDCVINYVPVLYCLEKVAMSILVHRCLHICTKNLQDSLRLRDSWITGQELY